MKKSLPALAYLNKSFTPENFQEEICFYSPKNILLVHGKKSYELCGAKDFFDRVLQIKNVSKVDFFDFEENPKIEDVEKGLSLFNEKSIDLIIAVGGGSVIDMAKLIRFFSAYSGTLESGVYSKMKDIVPLIVFPTTSGTGAEATHFAVCYKNNKKYSVANNDILPDKSFVVPEWTSACSSYLTACSGFDAFAQAVESYWSVKSTEESRGYAKQAIELIFPNLQECIENPTMDLRKRLAEGAHYAGKAINISFTTAAHAFSYGVTTYLDLPHGRAVACSFPYFFEENLNVNSHNCNDSRGVDFVRERMVELCQMLNLTPETVAMGLSEWTKKIFLPWQLNKLPDAQLWGKILSSVNASRLSNNPTKLLSLPTKNNFIW